MCERGTFPGAFMLTRLNVVVSGRNVKAKEIPQENYQQISINFKELRVKKRILATVFLF